MLHLKVSVEVCFEVPSQKIEMKQFICFLAVAVFLMTCMLGHAADPDKDLLIYVPFDEGKGNTAGDIGPNGFKGEIKNAKWVEGVVGQALHFNNGSVNFDPHGKSPRRGSGGKVNDNLGQTQVQRVIS